MSFVGPILTNNKDVNILILSKLSFFDLRNALLVNKAMSKYNNDILWFNYQKKKPYYAMMEKDIQRPWKEFSLCIIQVLDLSKGNYHYAMFLAAQRGQRDLIDFFICKGAKNWDWAMEGAAQGGHRDLVNFFIGKGAKDWNVGMYGAAQGGHRDLVNFFITQGANEWNFAMLGAAQRGHRDLVDFFIDQGANDWNTGMSGAAEGHLDLVEFFISKGANCWTWGLESATQACHQELIAFFTRKLGS